MQNRRSSSARYRREYRLAVFDITLLMVGSLSVNNDAGTGTFCCAILCRNGEQGSWTVNNGDAMVDGIQLGRVFTMFEKDEVRTTLTVLHVVSEDPLHRIPSINSPANEKLTSTQDLRCTRRRPPHCGCWGTICACSEVREFSRLAKNLST